MFGVHLAAAEGKAVIEHLEQVGTFALQAAVHRDRAADPAGAAGFCRLQAHQRDDVAGIGVETLRATGVIAARAGFDVAHIDDVAQQFALPGLRQRRADMGAETEIDSRHVVAGITRARNAAQQDKAAAETQFVAEAAEKGVEGGKREGVRRDSREVELALVAQMGKRRVDLLDLGGGEGVQAVGAIVQGGAGPGRSVLRCVHAVASLVGCERSSPSYSSASGTSMPISGMASMASPVSSEPTQRSPSRANTVAA